MPYKKGGKNAIKLSVIFRLEMPRKRAQHPPKIQVWGKKKRPAPIYGFPAKPLRNWPYLPK